MTTLQGFVNRLDDHVSNLEPRRALVAAVVLPLWTVGLIVGFAARIVWLVGAYLWSAAVLGFQTGLGRRE